MKDLTVVETTTIFSNIATVCGVIVSIIAIYFSVKQSKNQFKISQYENRKKIYDFLKDFQDNWLFYIEHSTNGKDKVLNIALNGFAKEFLSEEKPNPNKLLLEITKEYNTQYEKIQEISIYFNLSKKGKIRIKELKEILKLYYKLILEYYVVHNNYKSGDENKILSDLKHLVESFENVLLSEEMNSILDKMKKELTIY